MDLMEILEELGLVNTRQINPFTLRKLKTQWSKEQYGVKEYLLDTARDEKRCPIIGDFLEVVYIDAANPVYIKFNSPENTAINLLETRQFNLAFHCFYLTHSAEAGKKLKFNLGGEASFGSSSLRPTKVANVAGTDINPSRKEDIEAQTLSLKGTGTVYREQIIAATMGDDAAHTFTKDDILRDVIIKISLFDVDVGDDTTQTYPKGAGTGLGFVFLKPSTIYFKNAAAGSDAKIDLLGIE